MAKISEEEKREMLSLSKSEKLRRDFQKIEKNRKMFLKNLSPDEYIRFLSFFNKFIRHKGKSVEKMEGKNFKL